MGGEGAEFAIAFAAAGAGHTSLQRPVARSLQPRDDNPTHLTRHDSSDRAKHDSSTLIDFDSRNGHN